MGKSVPDVLEAVLTGGDAREAFFEDVDSQWVDTRYHYIKAEIELEVVDQERIVNVRLRHLRLALAILLVVVDGTCQVYSSSLAVMAWLDNVNVPLVYERLLELI